MQTQTLLKISPILTVLAISAFFVAPGAADVATPATPVAAEAVATTAAPTTDTASSAATVRVFNNGFEDTSTGLPLSTIVPGDSVTFVFEAGVHSATQGVSPEADPLLFPPITGFDSGLVEAGNTFTVTIGDTGVYSYYCSVHGGMKGVIVVA